MGDQVFRLAFNVEPQFGLPIGLGVRTENAIVPAPHGNLAHVVSCRGACVAPRTFGDGKCVRFPTVFFDSARR